MNKLNIILNNLNVQVMQRTFQAEGISSGKALGLEDVWNVIETMKRPV